MSEDPNVNSSRRRFLIVSASGTPATFLLQRIGVGTAVFAFAESIFAQIIPNGNWRGRSQFGSLWAWGRNTSGQVGNSSLSASFSSPVHIGAMSQYGVGSAGYDHTLAIRFDASLWAWGNNSSNAVGLPGASAYSSPVQIAAGNWKAVAAGNGYNLARRSDDSLWAWGTTTAALGVGDKLGRSSPVQVGALTNWKDIAAKNHSVALKSNGTLWAWGPNDHGQLGDGTNITRTSPIQVGAATDWASISIGPTTTAAVKSNGTLWAWGDLSYIDPAKYYVPKAIDPASDWLKVFTGGPNSHAIKTNGTLWSWGLNQFGEVGDGTTTPRLSPVQIGAASWSQVSSALDSVCAIRSDGALFSWGRNVTGQLGHGDTVSRSSPTQVGTLTNWRSVKTVSYSVTADTVATRTDGTMWYWGHGDSDGLYNFAGRPSNTRSPVQLGSASDWGTVDTDMMNCAAIKTNGTLWTWGNAAFSGERGYPLDFGVFSNWLPGSWLAVANDGGEYTENFIGVKSDGTLWVRGWEGSYPNSNYSVPRQISADTNWAKVAAGYYSGVALARKSDGTLYSIGSGPHLGRFGGEMLTQIGTDSNWKRIAVGRWVSFATKSDNTLWAWGDNTYGQLGDGTTTSRTLPAQVGTDTWADISIGEKHVIGRKMDGTVWTWGANDRYQLGDGTTTPQLSPNQKTAFTGGTIAAGVEVSLVIKTDGTLWGWGGNNGATLGDNTGSPQSLPIQIGSANDWSVVRSSGQQSGGIKTNGTLWTWGVSREGQIGQGAAGQATYAIMVPTQVGSATNWIEIQPGGGSLAIKSDGTVWTTGGAPKNFYQTFIPRQVGTDTNWSTVSLGGASTDHHVLALRTNGTLWAFGKNSVGQLGDGTTVNRSSPVQIGAATNWTAIQTGFGRSFAIRSPGTLFSFGYGLTGSLGVGNDTNQSSPTQVGAATNWTSVAISGDRYAPTTQGVVGGVLYGWGTGTTSIGFSSPVQVGASSNWSTVALGGRHVIAIRTDGTLWGWANGGANSDARYQAILAIGQNFYSDEYPSPVQIGSDSDWSTVVATEHASAAIKTNKSLWLLGYNNDGRLAQTYDNVSQLTRIGTTTDWVWVSLGPAHSIAGK